MMDYHEPRFPAPPYVPGQGDFGWQFVEESRSTDRRFCEVMDETVEKYRTTFDLLREWGFTFQWRPRDPNGEGWVYINLPRPQDSSSWAQGGGQIRVESPEQLRIWFCGVVAGRDSVTGDYDDEPFGHLSEPGLSPTISDE